MNASSAIATVAAVENAGVVADVRLYESTNDDGVTEGSLFDAYTTTALAPAAANYDGAAGIWYRSGGPSWDIPAWGKSAIARGSDPDETSTPVPTGVYDLQGQTPNSAKLTVAAFVAPVGGTYTISSLYARRTTAWAAGTTTFKVFDSSASLVASIVAGNAGVADPAWKAVSGAGALGPYTLAAGDKLYFALDSDGVPDNDATEVAFTITAVVPIPQVYDLALDFTKAYASDATTTLASSSFTPEVGDVLVVSAISYWASTTPMALAISNSGFTVDGWTEIEQAYAGAASDSFCNSMWVGRVTASADTATVAVEACDGRDEWPRLHELYLGGSVASSGETSHA